MNDHCELTVLPTFSELMQNSIDGIFSIGVGQTVVTWNRACESITGIPASKALGSHCHDVLKGQDTNGRPLCKFDCPLSSLVNGGPPPSTLPMRITHQDGKRIQLCVGTMLMPSQTRNEWAVVHVMRRSRGTEAADFFACSSQSSPDACPSKPAQHNAALLTNRERDVPALLAEGSRAEAISVMLHISASTVRNHIQRLMAKLGVHSRHEAVAFAHRHNMAESSH